MSDEWIKCGPFCWQNAAGYRIAAARVGERLRYSVFAPPAFATYGEYAETLKARYAHGERVPQQRELLGCFDDPESARAAAARHLTTQPAHGGDHANATSNQQQLEIEIRAGTGRLQG